MHVDGPGTMNNEGVRTHDRLLGELYDAVWAPDGFQPFIRLLAEVFGLKGVVLLVRHVQTRDATGIWQHGLEPVWLEKYALTYGRDDVLAAHLERAQIGRFYASNLDLPNPERLIENRFFREWAIPQDLAFAAASVVLREGPWETQVFLQRSGAHGPFTRAELEQFDLLVPHWQRAAQMRQRLVALRTSQELLSSSLDAIAMPALLFDEAGLIVHKNAAAETLLRNDRSLRDLNGRLVATSPDTTRELQLQISNAVRTHREGRVSETSIVAVRRPGQLSLTTTILPLRGGQDRSLLCGALMFVFDPERTPAPSAELVRKLFALTAAEAELAVALCGGQSAEEIAIARGRSLSTVRSQLRSLFAKTGTKRQSDLIGLLLASPASFVTREPQDAIC